MKGFLVLVFMLAMLAAFCFACHKGYLLIENFRQTRKFVWFTKHLISTLCVMILFSGFFALLDEANGPRTFMKLLSISPIFYVFALLAIPFGWLTVSRYKHGLIGTSERIFGYGMEDLRKLPRKPGEKIWPWPW